ncbi:hypothetical protein V2G26_008262 [Clonostachys chloroleuca]
MPLPMLPNPVDLHSCLVLGAAALLPGPQGRPFPGRVCQVEGSVDIVAHATPSPDTHHTPPHLIPYHQRLSAWSPRWIPTGANAAALVAYALGKSPPPNSGLQGPLPREAAYFGDESLAGWLKLVSPAVWYCSPTRAPLPYRVVAILQSSPS